MRKVQQQKLNIPAGFKVVAAKDDGFPFAIPDTEWRRICRIKIDNKYNSLSDFPKHEKVLAERIRSRMKGDFVLGGFPFEIYVAELSDENPLE
jgi:hypothetical protein